VDSVFAGAASVAWAALLLAFLAVAAFGLLYRRMARQQSALRRALAREASLKARLDDVFERSSEILIVHDRRGRVTTINRAGEQAAGYSRDELRSLDPAWIFGPDYLDQIQALVGEGAEGTPRSFRSELVPRKGPRVPVEVHARVLVSDGSLVGVATIARDLSERERLETQLRQAQKMEAVGRLATGIAHDFNNLITVLLGYSDDLLESVSSDSESLKSAQEIRRAAERAAALTQQLLAFSRRHAAIAEIVDVNTTVSNMESLIRRLVGPDIRVEISLAPRLDSIRADAAQIGQVLMNLAVNARDAMPNGGVLGIETANAELGSEHLEAIPGPHVMLAVRDTGVGMPDEVRRRVFEPFFTTKDTGRGTGLGLSMIQGIVRQSMGYIAVESEPGKGSTFRVYFPRAEDAPARRPAAPADRTRARTKGAGVVLLAEDDRAVRELLAAELTRRGFTVMDAEDGLAALEVFTANKDRIDLVVSDVVMPRLNGAGLAAAIEKMRPGTKVLFISGHPERAGVGLDPSSVQNLLMKPFTSEQLAGRIQALLEGPP
jgi:PAS domain S-box-containing protein